MALFLGYLHLNSASAAYAAQPCPIEDITFKRAANPHPAAPGVLAISCRMPSVTKRTDDFLVTAQNASAEEPMRISNLIGIFINESAPMEHRRQ